MRYTTRRFWECYDALPEAVQRTADRNYNLLKATPNHPSLHFKKVGKYWSIRAGRGYRALGVEVRNGILWLWIGTHGEYDRLIAR
ncbi:MAG: hypothetical protein SW833_26805 [Cyanobacteriota bacterium]|nr:hypothetical protein [Cyanobacteriota bacterium]